jgi:hypothetical protein
MNKTPTKYTRIYLHLTHLHVLILSDHLQGATVPEHLDINMCLSTVQSLFIYVEPSSFTMEMRNHQYL